MIRNGRSWSANRPDWLIRSATVSRSCWLTKRVASRTETTSGREPDFRQPAAGDRNPAEALGKADRDRFRRRPELPAARRAAPRREPVGGGAGPRPAEEDDRS